MLFYTLVSLSSLLHFIYKRSKILEKTPCKYFNSDTLNFPQNVVVPNTHKLSSILPLVVWANLLFVFLLTLSVHFSYLKSWLFSLVPSLRVSNTHEKQKTRAKRLLNTHWGLPCSWAHLQHKYKTFFLPACNFSPQQSFHTDLLLFTLFPLKDEVTVIITTAEGHIYCPNVLLAGFATNRLNRGKKGLGNLIIAFGTCVLFSSPL